MNDDIQLFQGTLFRHGYEYKKFLGRGGFSSVLLCHSIKYNQDFAIKRAIKHRMTKQEYDVMISLHHPNIVQLYDSFNDNSAQYLVMEYCQNGTLKQKGCLTYEKFIFYAKQILEAISFCHSMNIAHRDIKPDNIFIDQYNHIKLADFGMANKFENNCKSSEKCGSFCYFAPEMFHSKEIDPFKADIWALGITFFYMMTGNVPYTYESRDELKEKIIFGELEFDLYDVDPDIRYLIRKMTEKNVKLRPSAHKLLKLPIFQSILLDKKSSGIIDQFLRKPLPVYKTMSKISPSKSLTFESVGNESSEDEKQPPRKINSYKSVLHLPATQRSTYRFQLIKPMKV